MELKAEQIRLLPSLFRRLSSTLGALVFLTDAGLSQDRRPMVVDDLFALEQLGPVVGSPDGEWLAVVIVRASTSAETYRGPTPDGVAHADIWLVPRSGGPARNLTNGLADSRGYWNPVWSPDSRRLAMLTTQGGETAHPVMWDMGADSVRQLTQRSADLGAYGDLSVVTYGMWWSNDTTLLCPITAVDAPPQSTVIMRPQPYTTMVREWAKAERGIEPSVSVLESGRELRESERPQGQLVAIDVVSGTSRLVAEGNFRQLLLGPSGRHAVLIAETGRIPPSPSRRIPTGIWYREVWRTRLFVLPLDKETSGMWIDDVVDPKLVDEKVPYSWSPDGSSVAVIARADRNDETTTTLWVVSVTSGAARRVTGASLEVSTPAWSLGGDLLALARPTSRPGTNADSARFDWWRVDSRMTVAPKKLTSRLAVVPPVLVATAHRRTMLGIAAGDLWSINVERGTTQNVTDAFEPTIEREVWPIGLHGDAQYARKRVFATKRRGLYQYDLIGPSPRITSLSPPVNGASVAAFDPDQQVVAYTGSRPTGTFLWTSDGRSGRFEERIALNGHVGQIADAKPMLLSYRSGDGEPLNALLLLPYNYEESERYPLVTMMGYPGWMVYDTTSGLPWFDKQSTLSINLAPLIAQGFVVLIPSLPFPISEHFSDPYLEMPKGVLPAVDKVVDLGIADPDRLVLMGHSNGGYVTHALLAYTKRFKVAVSLAGFSDLVSLYGQYATFQRYGDFTHEHLINPAASESGPLRMVDTPWGNLWGYLRNSPINFADRIQTPLMIIHGDMDYVPMEQAEQLFTALYRLGKKAKYVRYWGEGHIIYSPANVRDMWRRIFGWIDEHLLKADPKEASQAVGGHY